jgi:hypothetical protein
MLSVDTRLAGQDDPKFGAPELVSQWVFRDNTRIAFKAVEAPRATTQIEQFQWRVPGDADHNIHVAGTGAGK